MEPLVSDCIVSNAQRNEDVNAPESQPCNLKDQTLPVYNKEYVLMAELVNNNVVGGQSTEPTPVNNVQNVIRANSTEKNDQGNVNEVTKIPTSISENESANKEESEDEQDEEEDNSKEDIYLSAREFDESVLPRLLNGTSRRKKTLEDYISPAQLRDRVYRCKEFPNGIYINKYGEACPEDPRSGIYKLDTSIEDSEEEEEDAEEEDGKEEKDGAVEDDDESDGEDNYHDSEEDKYNEDDNDDEMVDDEDDDVYEEIEEDAKRQLAMTKGLKLKEKERQSKLDKLPSSLHEFKDDLDGVVGLKKYLGKDETSSTTNKKKRKLTTNSDKDDDDDDDEESDSESDDSDSDKEDEEDDLLDEIVEAEKAERKKKKAKTANSIANQASDAAPQEEIPIEKKEELKQIYTQEILQGMDAVSQEVERSQKARKARIRTEKLMRMTEKLVEDFSSIQKKKKNKLGYSMKYDSKLLLQEPSFTMIFNRLKDHGSKQLIEVKLDCEFFNKVVTKCQCGANHSKMTEILDHLKTSHLKSV